MIYPAILFSLDKTHGAIGCSDTGEQVKVAREDPKYSADGLAPGWWFQNFHPLWKPLVQWLQRQRHMTLSEFQLITSRISEMTAIEKTIAVSAFMAYKNMQQ